MPAEAPPVPASSTTGGSLPPGFAPGPNLSSAFDVLEAKGVPPEAEPGTVPKSPAQKMKDSAEQTNKPKSPKPPTPEDAAKPAEDEASKPTDQPKPGEQQQAKPKKPSDFLREKLVSVETERDSLKAEIAKLKTVPADDPEKKSLSEKLQAESKRRQELEDEMRYTRYEKSPEYHQKYEKPYTDSWEAGRELVGRLNLTDAEGNVRQGTGKDWDALMNLYFSDPEKAADVLTEVFGNKANLITPQMVRVAENARSAQSAIEQFRKDGSEREQLATTAQKQLHDQVRDQWNTTIKPEFIPAEYKAFLTSHAAKDGTELTPEQKEDNTLIERGYKKFDAAMGLDARKARTTEERNDILGKTAAQRHLAANARKLVKWVQRRDGRIAELEKELKQYQSSEPGGGDAEHGRESAEPKPGTMASVDAMFDKKAKPFVAGQFL